MLNKNFINYAVKLLYKDRKDHAFSFLIFSFIVFVLSCVLFVSGSLQHDLLENVHNHPDVVVENTRAGKLNAMHDDYLYNIENMITGVQEVEGVVDGLYYFAQKRVWFRVVGDESVGDNEMVLGQGVKEAINELYYHDEFNFFTEERRINVKIDKDAPAKTSALTNNTIFLSPKTARAVLSLEPDEYTKIYVSVPNENEVGPVALKINELYPGVIALTREDVVSNIKSIYYYKGGIFMVVYLVAIISFLIMLKNQINLAYGGQRKEIAILRSIGYSIKDIINLKLIQNVVVSVSAYLFSVSLAYIYVFVFHAPLFKNIFLGSEVANNVSLTPVIDFNVLFLIFIFMIIPFLAFVIIPSWKIAISDISEAMSS